MRSSGRIFGDLSRLDHLHPGMVDQFPAAADHVEIPLVAPEQGLPLSNLKMQLFAVFVVAAFLLVLVLTNNFISRMPCSVDVPWVISTARVRVMTHRYWFSLLSVLWR